MRVLGVLGLLGGKLYGRLTYRVPGQLGLDSLGFEVDPQL